ncbi:hypothetical protein [Streptomyces bambusae]|uniref:Secreted protein n=1 Tax=Streptomyces bambusae TaxID=1550616 RepID=A0ABS6Z8D8_9ACTN|nr:hypothetical protein [Streptomyces bambusae]MBW5484030.1 hypothetical protein [Streptomyces bambusae]
MSIRRTVKVRGGAAAAIVAVLALTLAGCGGDDDKTKSTESQKNGSQSHGASAPSGGQAPAPTAILATVNGESGMVLTISGAQRDAGGFLTVSGQLKNTGGEAYVKTTPWRGNELTDSGTSVAGVTLVDKVGKKRYYVLRDTDGRCLCTTGLATIEAGKTVPFFAQFPAPPATTAELEFSLPTFATATIKISG